ncbi:hypothetical protein Tco_1000681 [Tanacetum coccineum]
MLILHSFKENKLVYEDKDEVEIKMMGTGMDKELLEHNLYENDITSIISLGWHLEEIHVTWDHLEKKRTRLRLYTKSFEEIAHTELGDGIANYKQRRHIL